MKLQVAHVVDDVCKLVLDFSYLGFQCRNLFKLAHRKVLKSVQSTDLFLQLGNTTVQGVLRTIELRSHLFS